MRLVVCFFILIVWVANATFFAGLAVAAGLGGKFPVRFDAFGIAHVGDAGAVYVLVAS